MLLKRYPRIDGLRILSVEKELVARNGPLKIVILGGFFVAFFSEIWISSVVAGFGSENPSFGALTRLISAFSVTFGASNLHFGAILPDSLRKKNSLWQMK